MKHKHEINMNTGIIKKYNDLVVKTNFGFILIKNYGKYKKMFKVAPFFFFFSNFYFFVTFVVKNKHSTDISHMDVFRVLSLSCVGMFVFSYFIISPKILSGKIGKNIEINSDVDPVSWRYIEPFIICVISISYIVLSNI